MSFIRWDNKVAVATSGETLSLGKFSKRINELRSRVKNARKNIFSVLEKSKVKSSKANKEFLARLFDKRTNVEKTIESAYFHEIMFVYSQSALRVAGNRMFGGSHGYDDTGRNKISFVPITYRFGGKTIKFRHGVSPIFGKRFRKADLTRKPSMWMGRSIGSATISGGGTQQAIAKAFTLNAYKNFRSHGSASDYTFAKVGTDYTLTSNVPSLYRANTEESFARVRFGPGINQDKLERSKRVSNAAYRNFHKRYTKRVIARGSRKTSIMTKRVTKVLGNLAESAGRRLLTMEKKRAGQV